MDVLLIFKINDFETGIDFFFEIKPGTNLCRQHNLRTAFEMAKKQLLFEQNALRINNIGIIFDCSDSDYEKVLKLREIISQNNYSQSIILTHRLEADYLKEIILKNYNNLSALDMTLQDIDISNELKNQFKNQQGIPDLNNKLQKQYNDIGEKIEEKIKNPSQKCEEKINNGFMIN